MPRVVGRDASTTAYAAQWSYSTGGRITSLVKGASGAPTTSTYTYTDTAHPAAVTQVTGGATTDSFGYDSAGRETSRTVNGVTTALSWDVTSSLTESNGQGGHVFYSYDASGNRVMQVRVADANGPGTATVYVGSGEIVDPNTASTSKGDTKATRYYTFAGSTVAVRTNDGKLSLMLGDEQGSTNVMMPVTVQASGALAAATLADAQASTRTAYTPYGQLRGADNLAVDRGWLGQVEDRVVGTGATSTGTGLTYLNARYYDPATSRFISPDPIMDLGDPKTLDPYRYADDNPVVFTDASGLEPRVWADGHVTGAPGVSYATKDGRISSILPRPQRGSKAAHSDAPPPNPASYAAGSPELKAVYNFVVGDDVDQCFHGSGVGAHVGGCAMLGANFIPGIDEGKWGLKGGGKGLMWLMRIGKHADEVKQVSKGTEETVDVAKSADKAVVAANAPRQLPLDRPISRSATQNQVAWDRVAELQDRGATDIRLDQAQVNAAGVKVGTNRPDLQFTLDGTRYYEEFESPGSNRGPGHLNTIFEHDPNGVASVFLGVG